MGKPVVVRSKGSFRNEVEAGRHRFVIDEPVEAGGTDDGPTPYDLLGAALGGCISMTLVFYARREKLPLEGVNVTVSHARSHAKDCADCTTKSGFIHRFKVDIELFGPLTEDQRQKLLGVAGRCPVGKTLGSEIKIEESLVAARA